MVAIVLHDGIEDGSGFSGSSFGDDEAFVLRTVERMAITARLLLMLIFHHSQRSKRSAEHLYLSE